MFAPGGAGGQPPHPPPGLARFGIHAAAGAVGAGLAIKRARYDSGMDSNQEAPMDAAQATGGGGGGGGASAPLGSVLQHSLGPVHESVHKTMTFRSAGTVHINDTQKANGWVNVPWEFPRLWLRNRSLVNHAKEYSHYRTKSITITFKNPHQKTQTVNGTVTDTKQEPAARVHFWKDKDYITGCPLFSGWSAGEYQAFCKAYESGGFDDTANTAYKLPKVVDMGRNPVNNFLPVESCLDGAPGMESIAAQVGTSNTQHWHATNRDWRSTVEFTQDAGFYQAAGVSMFGATRSTPVTATDMVWWRGDNVSCLKRSRAFSLFSMASNAATTSNIYTIENQDIGGYGVGITATTSFNGDSNLAGAQCPVVKLNHVPSQAIPYYTTWNEVEEHHPIPQLWVTYENMVSQDFTSISNQLVGLQIEYTWEVELTGKKQVYDGCFRGYIAGSHWDDNERATNTYQGAHLGHPRYTAVPFYSTVWESSLAGTDITIGTSDRTGVNTLKQRYANMLANV